MVSKGCVRLPAFVADQMKGKDKNQLTKELSSGNGCNESFDKILIRTERIEG